MSKEVKAIILCNNPIAIPGIREFLFYGKVGAIVVTKRNKEMQQIVTAMVGDSGVPVVIVTRKDFKEKIADAIRVNTVNVGLMMTFPFVLPEAIWRMPEKGFINFHYGLLPQCRGPQPVLWHMLNNDREAGVTLHKVDGGIDTGEIVMQEKLEIRADETYGSLQARLGYLASKPAANLLKILSFGSVIPSRPQDESQARYFDMPGQKELMINWEKMEAAAIQRLVNACNPWNKGAGTIINEWLVGVTEVEIAGESANNEIQPGTILACDKANGLLVQTCDNKQLRINIIYLQEGFFSGYRISDFSIEKGMRFS